jgi:hypothetical protein
MFVELFGEVEDGAFEFLVVPSVEDVVDDEIFLFYDVPWNLVYCNSVTAFNRRIDIQK